MRRSAAGRCGNYERPGWSELWTEATELSVTQPGENPTAVPHLLGYHGR
jgi:hypothetical protein